MGLRNWLKGGLFSPVVSRKTDTALIACLSCSINRIYPYTVTLYVYITRK